MEKIYPQVWINLPKETKEVLIKAFDIPRTGITEIVDQRVVNDGYSEADLSAISLEKMIAYIGSTETFHRAWELTLAKVHSELHPPLGEIVGKEGSMTVAPIEEDVLPVNETDDAKTKKSK